MRDKKSFAFEVKAIDDERGVISGYLSTFGNIDETGDRVIKGAFKRTLKNKYEYKSKNSKKYLMPLLWQHYTDQPIGGFTEAQEDETGLYVEIELDRDVQKGLEAYSGLKKGYIYQMSMGYDCLKSEYVRVDNKTIRDLIEVRLWEGSIVTFPANNEAVVTQVKSASGKTDWPLGDRETAWDGSGAHKRIIAWASDADGNIDAAKMKSVHFWYDSSAPDNVTSYKLAFCDIQDDKPIAMPRGIFACAAALSGSRGGADLGGDDASVKSKIAGYYNRMAKEFDDESITVPWGKKDFDGNYAQSQLADQLMSWRCTLLGSLTSSLYEAMRGEQPLEDMRTNLEQFTTSALAWVEEGISMGMPAYLQQNARNYYYYDASQATHEVKAGRMISAANAAKIMTHANTLHEMADNLSGMLQEDDSKQKNTVPPLETHGNLSSSHDTIEQQELDKLFKGIQAVRETVGGGR